MLYSLYIDWLSEPRSILVASGQCKCRHSLAQALTMDRIHFERVPTGDQMLQHRAHRPGVYTDIRCAYCAPGFRCGLKKHRAQDLGRSMVTRKGWPLKRVFAFFIWGVLDVSSRSLRRQDERKHWRMARGGWSPAARGWSKLWAASGWARLVTSRAAVLEITLHFAIAPVETIEASVCSIQSCA